MAFFCLLRFTFNSCVVFYLGLLFIFWVLSPPVRLSWTPHSLRGVYVLSQSAILPNCHFYSPSNLHQVSFHLLVEPPASRSTSPYHSFDLLPLELFFFSSFVPP
ncbi:hypothetical protein BJX99DRAFT_139755 [Aspergillus californicus]